MDRLFLIGIHIFMLLWRLLLWVLQSKNVWHKIGWFWILLIGSAAIRNTHCLAIYRDCWFGISLIASAAIGDLYGMAFHRNFTFSFHGSALPNRDPYFHDFMTTYCLSFTTENAISTQYHWHPLRLIVTDALSSLSLCIWKCRSQCIWK